MEKVNRCRNKLKRLFKKLLKKRCRFEKDDFDELLTHIAQWTPTEHKIAKLVTKWVKKAVTKWSTARVPSRDLVVFVVDLILLLVRTEEKFRDLKRSDNFFVSLFSVLRQAKPELSIRVLLALVEHQSGTDFVVELGLWKSVFGLLACGDQTQCVCFMAKLLRKSGFQSDIVKELVLPLENHTKFFSLLLERCLEEVFSGVGDFDALFAFLGYYRFDDDIGDRALSKSYVFDSSKVRLTMQFVELYAKITSKSVTRTTVDVSLKKIKSSFLTNLSKQSFDEVIEFSRFGLLYWRLIESKIPETNSFSDQIVATFLISHYGFVLRNCLTLSKIEEACLTDEVRDVFVAKVMKMLGDVTRLHFIWRDRLIESPDLVKFCENSLLRVKECRYYLSRHQAVVFFQTLIYLTKDITLGLSESSEKIQVVREDADYICKIFDLLGIFIQEIRITWKDTVEALEVVNVCFEFLELCEWSEDVVVQVLTVVNVAVKKYMLPSLVLLVDITQDSTVALLGTFMKLKLEESGAKVKTAALKVVCTVAYLSNEKFPSLQKVLMDSELPTLVVKMSTCDGESFVRATAIKCLQEMIQVEEIWNNALKTEDLSQKMRDILLNETEGIVRVEAATFMCVAYEHQQFPKDSLDAIYETMIYSSTTDLHWEVKVRALNFWDKVIKNHLQNQGMIDGSFPNVTFSKEHRKIVTLTDSEIRKRLLKVLGQLSAIGCLGVLTAAIKDDCDMEVSKTAVKITQKLVDLLKKYAVGGECSGPTSPIPTESGMSMSSGISVDESMDSPRSSQPDLNEEIIEQIVNAKDASLLKGVYAPSDYGSVSNYDFQVRKIVTPTEFLQFTHQDLNNIIAEKKKWLNGIEDLGSLLDDMLKTYDEDVNSMDCY
ncbi:uncharacterized protein LOC135133272 isoform X14 [Zophobas morio]|uniref:uncharacterized protein LOC135133272 isoform X14 n=1 Tax=Zophobas morio TaxID=2755281 RepID=UPI0030838FFE